MFSEYHVRYALSGAFGYHYAESLKDRAHLKAILREVQEIVNSGTLWR